MTDAELVEELAGMLVRIEANYERETSGPGSRFEGKRLEIVQAEAVLRRVREAGTGDRNGPLLNIRWMGDYIRERYGNAGRPFSYGAGADGIQPG